MGVMANFCRGMVRNDRRQFIDLRRFSDAASDATSLADRQKKRPLNLTMIKGP
jgi:hypothetical protein